jgi:hypothetical protein
MCDKRPAVLFRAGAGNLVNWLDMCDKRPAVLFRAGTVIR